MTHARFSVRYDGPALVDHTMDVRDLAPALLAIGEMFDAANLALNGDATSIRVNVRAHEPGCFSIDLDVVQSILRQGIALLKGDEVTAALNLKELLFGAAFAGVGLVNLLKWLRGRQPDRIERLPNDMVRLTIGSDTIDVPVKLLRLYQDIAVRTALEKVVEHPLQKDGVDTVAFLDQTVETAVVSDSDAASFKAPTFEERIVVEDVRKAAFSIVSLAFKEDNKWRLYDGQNQISATIADDDFLRRVDQNLVSFAKGDVLVCEVRFTQRQTAKGLITEHIVERVLEHRRAPRQLELHIDGEPQ